jgi:probable rRNA maturation factor
VEIIVSISYPAWRSDLPDAEAWCREASETTAAAASVATANSELTVVLTDDAEARALNLAYRGIDRATNVLSFPATDPAERDRLPAGAPILLGDVVIAYETVLAEAEAQAKTLRQHLGHLVVHGVLHLAGYDHQSDAEADEMEALETQILDGLGVQDPYLYRETAGHQPGGLTNTNG